MNKEISKTQQKVLAYIQSHLRRVGYAPSIADVANKFKWRSRNAAYWHMRALKRAGYLKLTPRGFMPT